MPLTKTFSRAVDAALDRTVAPGFTRVGYAVRRRLPDWPVDPPAGALTGRTAVVTGANSGLGLATARGLAALGAELHLVVRDPCKGAAAADQLRAEVPGASLSVWTCDVSDLESIKRFTAEFAGAVAGVDVLVHNAGALPARRTESAQGHELTMALHVLGPIAMTEQLLPALSGRDARVIAVTSGGMYTQPLRDDDPDYHQGAYSGTTAYARSKRAQVELLGELGARWADHGIRVYATHPGWADTPGVETSLPGFHKVTGPLLRDAEQGADTTVWLAATEPRPAGGGLWHDRHQRPTHFRAKTRPTPAQVDRMWDWIRQQLSI